MDDDYSVFCEKCGRACNQDDEFCQNCFHRLKINPVIEHPDNLEPFISAQNLNRKKYYSLNKNDFTKYVFSKDFANLAFLHFITFLLVLLPAFFIIEIYIINPMRIFFPSIWNFVVTSSFGLDITYVLGLIIASLLSITINKYANKNKRKKRDFQQNYTPYIFKKKISAVQPNLTQNSFKKKFSIALLISIVLASGIFSIANYEPNNYFLSDNIKNQIGDYCSNPNLVGIGSNYNPTIKGIHKIAILLTGGGFDENSMFPYIDISWTPQSINDVQLVACFYRAEKTLFTCSYTDNTGQKMQVSFVEDDVNYTIFNSMTHQSIFNRSLYGAPPDSSCPYTLTNPPYTFYSTDPMNYTAAIIDLRNFVEIN